MSYKDFLANVVRKGPRRKKPVEQKFTEVFYVSLSPLQMRFVEELAIEEGTKKVDIVRKCINKYMVQVKENLKDS